MADEKLIFPIGFDLEEGVAQVEKDWGKMQKKLQDTFKSQTIQVDADISKAVLDKLYAKFEGLIKTMESKAPQIKLKIPDTVDFEQEINRLKVQLKSINLGELTDAESKDLYLYIRQLEALAKALKEVNKQEQLRQANKPEVIALKQAQAEEKLTRSLANSALAEQRRAKIATESARQDEINNRSAQRSAVIAEQKRAATARAENAELRLTRAKERSTQATHEQNSAYKTQSGYLSRLFQRMVAYASVAQAFSLIRNIRDVTAEFELQRVALGSIIGDLNKANAMFEQIKAAAVKSPFQIKELVTYTKQLAAYKIESDELFETTQRLADISAGLGVGMERLVLAYGQIRATGYLRASEVRQLTEAGIPIVEELAKKMSQLRGETVSAAEVMGLISERAISFGMVKEVFDDMTSAGGMFYKMQEKQAETLAGQWSNLKDSISIMYDEIGNTESVNNAMKGLIGLVKSLAENWRVVGDVAVWSVGAAMGYAKVIKPISELIQKHRLLNKAKQSEIYIENNLARIRALNAQKANYIAEGLAVEDDGYLQWIDEQIKYHQDLADQHTKIASEARKSATALKGFGGALKSIGSFIKANWVGMLITAVTALVSWLISARQEANRLNKELAKIGTEGALQADQSVRNFERLALAIRESADGSAKQTEALEEMKRAYGEFLPSQDKSIINLVREKDGYNAVTQAIREKIALQIQEQKLNTIASEYGSQFTKWEGKIATDEMFKRFSKEEISLIVADIKNVVNEGLISTANEAEDNAKKIQEIIKNITGEEVRYDAVLARLQGGLFGYGRGLKKLIETQENYNSQIQDVENSMESATGSLGKYTQAYKDFKEELKDVTGTGEKFSFEWNESKTKAEIKAYNKFIGGLLAKEGIKFDIGEAIDFKGLYEALGDNYPQFKQVIAKIQKEYEKLIPTDITRLANDKLQEYADKVGISMDEVKEHLKTNEQSTEDWAKGLKGAYESAEKKLAEYKKNQEAFSKQGAPFRDWSEDIEETTKEMEVLKLLMEFFKEFLSQSGGGKKTNPRIALLNEELSTVEKIYKEYQELRKFISEDDARARIADMFEGVNLTMLSQALSPTEMRAQLQKALDEAKKMGDKKQILELEYKLGKFDADEEQRKLEKSLKDLSDKISRTKTAKEFFNRMLGMTGDKELSATLTLSVYGTTGDDLQKLMTKQVTDAFKNLPEGFDITKAMLGGGKFDYNILANLVDKLPEAQRQNAQSIVDNWRKANADILTDLQKSYEDFMTYEERKTRVVERQIAERKKIEESQYDDDEKAKLIKASEKSRDRELADIAIEEFKASEDWAKSFEDLENLATPTIERLMTKLKEFIDTQGDLTLEQLKTLTNEYKKLYDGLIQRNPFKAISDGVKEYKMSIQGIKLAQKQLTTAIALGDEELIAFAERGLTDAFDEAQKALTKLKKGVDAVGDQFSQAASDIQFFANALGFSEDSYATQFLNGMANAFKGVSIAIGFADIAMKIFDGTIKGMLASNPIGWILLAVSAIISAVQVIMNARINRINKEIEALEDKLDNLEYAYDRLQKSAERAFGTEYIQNYNRQLANLEAQVEAYEKQLDAERSKGKKSDEDKITEYQNQIRDTKDAIEDMYGSLSEHFLGADLTSAARDFASAWIDAYKEFANTTDAMKAKFQDMIQNMIVESLIAKVMERALKPVFDMVDNMGDSDFYSNSFWSQLMTEMNKATENGVVGAQNIMGMLESIGINLRDTGTGLTGISRDIATASEESILGLAAGINTQNFYISQVPTKLDTIIGLLRGGSAVVDSGVNVQDLITIQNQFLSHLPTIAQNTAETVARCERAAVACESMASKLGSVIKPKGTTSTHSVNVTIGS